MLASFRGFLKLKTLFYTQKSDYGQQNGSNNEGCYYLSLAESAFFKVMMKGCHFKQTLSVSRLEVQHLYEAGKHFKNEYQARDQKNKQLTLHHSASDNNTAKEK
jgi:hypothetical protein